MAEERNKKGQYIKGEAQDTNKNGTAGRPPIYDGQNTINKVKEYLESCVDEDIQLVRQSNSEKGYEMYENKLKVHLPTIEGLASYLEVRRDTLYDWEKKYPDFSDILDEVRKQQAQKLIDNGLAGTYNPTIAKVLLTKHGYREGQELTGKDGEAIEVKQITGMKIQEDGNNIQDEKSKTT